jgi:hypothetical protein
MKKYYYSGLFTAMLLCTVLSTAGATFGATPSAQAVRQQEVTGGPRGPHPYLLKSVSKRPLLKTSRDYQWSITFPRQSSTDTLRIIALRVEFNGGRPDTSTLKTGNGLFGIRGGTGDPEEYKRYISNDTIYKYDRLPHDSLYFANQLRSLASYYAKISRGRLVLRSTIYPSASDQRGYAVPQPVIYYSPGGKMAQETWDEYYFRKTRGLMLFVRDALLAAAHDSSGPSPFANLRFEPSDSTIRDENNLKTVFLIFHAGASYLTDGGTSGSTGRNSPSDMIDAFIDRSWFNLFKKDLNLSIPGVYVKGASGDSIAISELMLCSETSNQDGLNWGVQGILVNQMARQLGIPDLFSTSSGVSAIGAFCIMDFAGYSAGSGFIPPYPSAWVRAFAGWDNVKTVSVGAVTTNRVKALTSVLDRDSLHRDVNFTDTTILLIPLNDHEYYLVENRQRNLSGNDSLFRFDSTGVGGSMVRVIAAYPYNVNLDSNVVATSGMSASNVIMKVRNNDVCLPASGVLVWHVDENIIRNRLANDLVNADSIYRGVALVEADGVFDLGITFTDVFYEAAYDYGGAEDVFPHRTVRTDKTFTVSGFGPYTAPSSRSNDGGNTYLNLAMQRGSGMTREERSAIRDYTVANFVDSVFIVGSSWNYGVPGWPKFAAPESFFDPLLADLDPARPGNELILLSKSGRLYGWSADTGSAGITYGNRKALINRIGVRGDTVRAADSAYFIDSIPGVVGMPSAIAGMVFIPSRDSGLRVLSGLSASVVTWAAVALGAAPSTYVCGYRSNDSAWAIGCEHGRVVFGKGLKTTGTLHLASDSAVCAIAALREKPASVAVIQRDGTLSLCTENASLADTSVKVPYGVGPFTLVTGDLNRDSASEIVVCDSRHGLWVYTQKMTLAQGWETRPSDWPSVYSDSLTHALGSWDRSKLPVNNSPPMLVDLNRDGYLDIVVGGTNGLYAFNYKGVLIGGWPSYLDSRFWYQRGSVMSAPIAVTGAGRAPLVIFSSPTGERATFLVAKIDSASRSRGYVWFKNEAGVPDSVWGLSAGLIDTLLTLNDSLVTPYATPGGFIDAVNAKGKRPLINTVLLPPGVSPVLMSSWPLTTGSSPAVSPLAGFMDKGAASPDLFAVSSSGWVYRWRLAREIMPDSLFWPEVGYDAGRSFSYGGGTLPILVTDKTPLIFFSYPNPTAGNREIMFKYEFSAPATNVRLDIFTFTGFRVFSSPGMGAPPSHLTGSYPDWNELRVPVDKLAPGLFRCRMEATVGGKKYVQFWKLAVTR